MPIPSAEEMRDTVKSKLLCMDHALKEANAKTSLIESLCPNVRTIQLDFADCVEDLLKTYFDDLCSALSREFSQGTPAIISIDLKRFTVENDSGRGGHFRRRREAIVTTDDSGESAIERLVNAIEFEKIETDVKRQASSLQQEGKSILANGLVSFLGLRFPHVSFKIKAGRICIDIYSANYWHRHDTIRDYSQFEDSLTDIRLETETDFGSAISMLKNAVMDMSYDEQELPSRTVFNKGAALEIICFRTKYEFRFTRSAFDAIAAYVTLHGNESSVAAITKLLDEANNQNAA